MSNSRSSTPQTAPVYEEDYQLWDANERKDTRRGKTFAVSHQIFIMIKIEAGFPESLHFTLIQ